MAVECTVPSDEANQMSQKTSLRLLVDGVMIISVLLAIANRLTENRIHELIGMALFSLILAHNLLNLEWYATIFHWRWDTRRIVNVTVNLALIVATAALVASSIPLSRTLFSSLNRESTLVLRQIHTTAAYWLLVLMSVHVGVHWRRLTASVKRGLPAISRIRLPLAFKLWLSMMAVLSGAIAAFERDIFSKLFMIYAFDFWDFEQSAAAFFMNYLAIVAALASITHNGLKTVPCRQKTAGKTQRNPMSPA